MTTQRRRRRRPADLTDADTHTAPPGRADAPDSTARPSATRPVERRATRPPPPTETSARAATATGDWSWDRRRRRRPSAGTSRPPPSRADARDRLHARPAAGSGVGTVLAAALLSAVLASGGTVLALNATGALDRRRRSPRPPPAPPSAPTTQPVTIDESSATIDVAAKVSPAVVRITVGASVDTSASSPRPASGPASSTTAAGWILTNATSSRAATSPSRAQRRPRPSRAPSTASTR